MDWSWIVDSVALAPDMTSFRPNATETEKSGGVCWHESCRYIATGSDEVVSDLPVRGKSNAEDVAKATHLEDFSAREVAACV
jgi:hypothetical protein